MELELWSEISAAISAVAGNWPAHKRDRYPTALIARVYQWAALHDRPVSWACHKQNWGARTCPAVLPDQSTMSRRARRPDFEPFLQRVGQRLNGSTGPAAMVKVVDGKALELANHTTDRDATWGRGVSRLAAGYKLHAIFSDKPMPDAFVITTLNVCEKQMAARMIRRVEGGGYLLADGNFDASWLFDKCHEHGHQLLCPRAKPFSGEAHRYVSEHRRRSIAMLEMPGSISRFGKQLYNRRTSIERQFAQLTCFGAGLGPLPAWIRRIWRVRHWVTSKLLANAARIRIRRRKGVGA